MHWLAIVCQRDLRILHCVLPAPFPHVSSSQSSNLFVALVSRHKQSLWRQGHWFQNSCVLLLISKDRV